MKNFIKICCLIGITISLTGFTSDNNDSNIIILNKNGDSFKIKPQAFYNTTNGEFVPQYATSVTLKYESATNSLLVNFKIKNDPYVAQNQYTVNNTDLWQQEVFEMFIAPGMADPTSYVEIEINPNKALFSSYIYNPSGIDPESATFFNGESAGMQVNVVKKNDSWSGSFSFPLNIAGELSSTYRVNFFRVVSKVAQDTSNLWSCTPITCEYLAWQPTFSGPSPAFHRTKYFGELVIIDR